MKAKKYPGLFKSRYNSLHSRQWLRLISAEDRKVFRELGLSEARLKNVNVHSLGGKARAKGKRDRRGRFTRDET